MPFEKVETQNVDFPKLEREMLQFWHEQGIFERLRQQNGNGQPWSFLDGPITANNPMGVHHAWGRTYKDAFNRYHAMLGQKLRYQNGFDCQGLWVEVEVEKELKLKSKRDIENLVPGDREASIAKFVQLCKDRVDKFARVQTEQSVRLGYWMDWDRTDDDWAKPVGERKSYFTMSPRNNEEIWKFLKKCQHRNLIYRGYDVMPWCGRCGVGISEQEMKDGYKLIEHKACFVKLPIVDRPDENLLVWTTTPWTLTSNVGAAINPELTYLKVKLKGELFYVAKGAFKLDRMASGGSDDDAEPESAAAGAKKKREWLEGVPHLNSIEQMFKSKAGKEGYEIVGEVKGEEMLGWRYVGPFDDLPAQQAEYGYPVEVARVVKDRGWCPATTAQAAHRVVSGGKDVTETEGTGIVHTAPGCGQIDFQWGKENGLPPVAPVADDGSFLEGFGPLVGLNAAETGTAEAVFEQLKANDRLFGIERYVHRYPHCWRCKTELIYRLVDEWFINMNWRDEIAKVVDQVTFLPEAINGRAREKDWLKNMGDWMISKKRFWGLALPIWVDEETGDFEVIGSFDELKERAVEGWDEYEGHSPHRPHIDKVKIRNPKTGNLMSRIPDVGNPWLDAGIVAFSTMPTDWYPAEFITESFPGQFRNWFYALLAMSTMMSDGKPPFKTLLGFATMRDQEGKPMHKSDGNSIEFISAADDGFELVHPLKPKAKPAKPDGAIGFEEIDIVDKETGKPVKAVKAKYPPIGADVMRWMYCRHNPASNLNFGPVPANEVRAKFHIKLWNCYAFFCNYARLDGFDPHAAEVPVQQRPAIDRWILSDLQGLIQTARNAFENYDVMGFCLEAERFVDDRLSNWYVRRNRDRFWSKNAELNDAGKQDKLAAYQTMYAVLRTLSQLIAPINPFLAEGLWQNLRTDADPQSVHLCRFPEVDPGLLDSNLSEEMNALLRLVSLGGAARNLAKHKVRQPLAELRIATSSEAEARAAKLFETQLQEELNVKAVSLHDASGGPMLQPSVKLQLKTAAAKLGPNRKQAEVELGQTAPEALIAKLREQGNYSLAGVELISSDFLTEYIAPEGWAGVADKGTQLMIDTRITTELKYEGMARDVIRLVQDARKAAGLDVSDKIELYLTTESAELGQAIDRHQGTIAGETQVGKWATASMNGESFNLADKQIDGHKLSISLKKVC